MDAKGTSLDNKVSNAKIHETSMDLCCGHATKKSTHMKTILQVDLSSVDSSNKSMGQKSLFNNDDASVNSHKEECNSAVPDAKALSLNKTVDAVLQVSRFLATGASVDCFNVLLRRKESVDLLVMIGDIPIATSLINDNNHDDIKIFGWKILSTCFEHEIFPRALGSVMELSVGPLIPKSLQDCHTVSHLKTLIKIFALAFQKCSDLMISFASTQDTAVALCTVVNQLEIKNESAAEAGSCKTWLDLFPQVSTLLSDQAKHVIAKENGVTGIAVVKWQFKDVPNIQKAAGEAFPSLI